MDPRLQGLFTSLGATFEAEIARDEEVAADDLAFSLRQGRSMADILERGAWNLLTPAGPLAITEVGSDYVMTGQRPQVVAPLATAVLLSTSEPGSVRTSDMTLVQLLRSVARTGATIEVTCSSSTWRGRLLWTGTDHLMLDTTRGQNVIGLAAVELIKVWAGGDADA